MASNADEVILDKVDECYRSIRGTAPPLFRCKYLDTAQTADSLAQLETLLTNWGLKELFSFFVYHQLYIDVIKKLTPNMAERIFLNHPSIPLGCHVVLYDRWSVWMKEIQASKTSGV